MTNSVKAVKERVEAKLLAIPGVSGVGYNGSINVYVKELNPKVLAFIPKTIEGITVHVIKGSFSLLSLLPASAIYSIRTGRFRPAPGGVSIGHYKVTAGTLTCKTIDNASGEVRGLGNNHVVALNWGTEKIGVKGDPELQPGPYDGGTVSNDTLGTLQDWIPVELNKDNLIDAGTFYSDQLDNKIEEVGIPEPSMEPYVGQKVLGSGRSSGLNFSTCIDVDATINVEGFGVCKFVHQCIYKPALLLPGDSGKWIGDVDTLRSVSLGFAGDPDISAANKMTNVESLLKLRAIPPLPYLDLRLAMGIPILGSIIANYPIGSRKK